MTTLYTRIKRRLLATADAFRKDWTFSPRLAVYRVIDDLSWRLGLKGISRRFHQKKDQFLLDYLMDILRPVLDSFKNDSDYGEYESDAPIWVCWWTGEDTAPELVKQCIRSIRTRAGSHPVHLITRENYRQYLLIPGYMLEKVCAGQMGLAHLSDYIRVSLLAQYGGLWLDATIFCAYQIPEECFSTPFFTCKSEPQPSRYLSQMQWTTFVLGGWKGNVFCRFLKQSFETYWRKEITAIDYLFFDYLIALGRQELPAIGALLEQVPVNNLRRDDLQAAMNRAEDPANWNRIVQPDTALYKLSWRETYSHTTPDGKDSIYHNFLEQDFSKE